MNFRLLKIFIIIFLYIFTFSSCNNSRNAPNNIISREKFTKILIEIHKTDALLNVIGVMDNKLSKPDSMSYYNKIFQEYGITRQQFYYTFNYYIENMADFMEIQQVVIDSLKNEFNRIDSLERLSLAQQDLWTLKRTWNLPTDGVTNSIPFKIIMQKKGNYTITAEIKSYPDDLSKDLSITIGVYYADTTEDVKTQKITVKDVQWHQYTLQVSTNPNKELLYISGEVLAHSQQTTYMHVQVKDIMLTFEDLRDANDTPILQ